LILLEPDAISAPATIKSVKPPVRVVAAEPPRGAALVEWVIAAAARAGAGIDVAAARLMVQMLYPQTWDRKPTNPRFDRPPEMALLSQEVEKLALLAHPGPIRAEHVRALVIGGPDQRLFRFIEAALRGDLRIAREELERFAAAGEEPAILLAQLLGQIELSVIAASAGPRDASVVARDLGTIAPSRISAIMVSARRQRAQARAALLHGIEVDRKLKSGRTRKPDDALLDLVLALADPSGADSVPST